MQNKKLIIGMIIFAAILNVSSQSNQTYIITTKNTIVAGDSKLNTCSFGDVGCYMDNTITTMGVVINTIIDLPMKLIESVVNYFKTAIANHYKTTPSTIIKVLWFPFESAYWMLKTTLLFLTNPWEGIKAGGVLLTGFILLLGTPFLVFMIFYHGFILVYVLITAGKQKGGLTIYNFMQSLFNAYFYIINLLVGRIIWPIVKLIVPDWL
jgi:hypothetical protein